MEFRLEWILPELYQLGLVLFLFVLSLNGKSFSLVSRLMPWLAGFGLIPALSALSCQGTMLLEAYRIDPLSQFFKAVISLGFVLAVLNVEKNPSLDKEKGVDYFMFLSLSTWGLMLLSSAVELITIFIALELASYSLYALIPLRSQQRQAAEAGIKYIMFGAAATALALYGLSYITAAQHTTYLVGLAGKDWTWANQPMAVLGLTLFLSCFFFKLGLFPFHFWAPDVYQGAGNETAAYVATLPKLGAIVVLIRLSALLKPDLEITTILAVLAAISITYGNLAALVQTDVKRILGYSTVAHAGYVLIGLVAVTKQGLAAAGFYALAYVLMNLTCFWVVCRVAEQGKNVSLDDLNGLHQRAPGLAFILAIGAFSLVGLPPTAGFMGKLFLLTAAWNHGYNWLVILAAVNTAISIYYYLNLVRHAYTNDEPERAGNPDMNAGYGVFWGGVLASLVLLLGILPATIFEYALKAGRTLLP